MTRHRYPAGALAADYARAALGLVLTAPPLALVAMNPVLTGVFAALVALFAVFAAGTLLRQLGPVELDESGIAVAGPWPRRLDWTALERMSLRWFAARRDKRGGFMQLVLRGKGRRLALDSRIDGFEAIAAAAATAAQQRGLALGETTLANLAALGIMVDDDRPA